MEQEKVLTVRNLKEKFDLEHIVGDDNSLNRPINVADVNRPGLELAGFYEFSQHQRIIILGDKEDAYLKTLSDNQLKKRLNFITGPNTPAIIISRGNEINPRLEKMCKRKNFPVLRSNKRTANLVIDVITFLDEELAPNTNIHGGLLSIFGKGVLIKGESGMGKSEVALELIRKGHVLIADDRVDVTNVHNRILGKAPDILKGMLEIRGVGIIDVSRMYGASCIKESAEIELIVELQKWDDQKEYARAGVEDKIYENILGVNIPKVIIPVREGRSMGVIVESAVTNFTLCQLGFDSSKEFENRIINFIVSKNK